MKKVITIRTYEGNNDLVQKLNELMIKSPDIIKNIIIHGSIATGEEISYSDFDGLLIVNSKETSVSTQKYRKFIKETLKLIYTADPFQHHGWLIINENDFPNYPQSYFPYELYEFSRTLGNNDLDLNIQISDEINFYYPFKIMREKLLELILHRRPKNLYQLKGFLSGLMLMPCLYLQAKYRKGFYKKHSFGIAKGDFTISSWQSIEKASLIRNIWEYKLNPIQKYLMKQPHIIFRKLTKYYLSPRIPSYYNSILNESFYRESLNLLDAMEERISNHAY